MNKQEVFEFLQAQGVTYEVTEHKAVYNMDELAEVELPYPEADAKNLFVRDDKKSSYYLITVRGGKRVDLQEFRKAYGTRRLTISYYDINKEPNRNYKILVEKEYEFIKKNQKLISRHASILYNQKTKEDVLFATSRKKPGYLEHVIDFKYAEKLYDEYISKELFTL